MRPEVRMQALDYCTMKLPFCYVLMKGPEFFDMPATMERSHFANVLDGTTECTEEEHQLLLEVKEFFGLVTYGDLHDLYLATDVLALADIIHTARRNWFDDCALDLAHSVTLPGASFKKMLKVTGVEIETCTTASQAPSTCWRRYIATCVVACPSSFSRCLKPITLCV